MRSRGPMGWDATDPDVERAPAWTSTPRAVARESAEVPEAVTSDA